MLHQADTEHGSNAVSVAIILASAFGMMFLARYALGFLAPQLQPDLHLEPGHFGFLAALLAAGWSVSGWIVSRRVAQLASIRTVLAFLLLFLAICSFAVSEANGIIWLSVCALGFGIAGGPVLPLIQSIAMRIIGRQHRGLVMGLVQSAGGSVIAKMVGPLVLVPCAEHFGWRISFIVVGVFALVCAGVVLLGLPRQPRQHTAQDAAQTSTTTAQPFSPPATGSVRNIVLCCCIGSLMVAWLMLATSFYPLYLTTVRHFSPVEMSELIATAGMGSLMGVVLVPWISDYIGRRPAIAVFALLGMVAPVALLNQQISGYLLVLMLFSGSFAGGVFPLFMSIVPAESVPTNEIARAISVVQAVSEMVGGVAIPLLMGWLANQYGLKVPVIGTLVATLTTCVLALGIQRYTNQARTVQ